MTYQGLIGSILPVTVAALLGCGGADDTSDAPSCELVTACGGDAVGDWTLVDFCPDTNEVPEGITQICETASLEVDDIVVSGSLSFKGDQTFVQSSSAKGTGYLVLDAACLNQGMISLTCAQVEDAINERSGTDPVSCQGSDGGCRCALSLDLQVQDEGSYAVAASKLTLMSEQSGDLEAGYCVQGTSMTLDLKLTPSGNAGDAAYEVGGQLKLAKQ